MGVFTESFDPYSTYSSTTIGVLSRWTESHDGSLAESNLIAGRFGGQAVQIGDSSASGNTWTEISCLTGLNSLEFSMNFAVYGPQTSSVAISRIVLCDNSLVHLLQFVITTSGRIVVYRGGSKTSNGTLLFQSDVGLFQPGVWHTVSVKGLLDATVGTLAIRLDGLDEIFDGTGLNTGSTPHQAIAISGYGNENSSEYAGFDDIVLVDDDSAYLPELRIQQLLPTGDGGTLNLTPSTGVNHYALVDEAICSISDYLSGSAVGDRDLLTTQDISVIPASILGVNVRGVAAKTDVATRAWNLGIRSAGTTDDNGSDLSLSNSPQHYQRFLALDPATGLAWTQSGINGIELAPRVAV